MRRREDLTFPFAEYERRLRELRERMSRRGLDAVVVSDPKNLMYLTDTRPPGTATSRRWWCRWRTSR